MEIKDRKKIVRKLSLYVKHDKLCVHLAKAAFQVNLSFNINI